MSIQNLTDIDKIPINDLKDINQIITSLTDEDMHLSNLNQISNNNIIFYHIIYQYKKPIAFIVIKEDKELSMNSNIDKRVNAAYIIIATHPLHRNQNHAKHLLTLAFNWFISNPIIEQLIYRVQDTNYKSINLAKATGFSYGWSVKNEDNINTFTNTLTNDLIFLITNPKNLFKTVLKDKLLKEDKTQI